MFWISSLKSATYQVYQISYKPCENGDIGFSSSYVTSCWLLDQRVVFGSLFTLSQHLAKCGAERSSAGWDTYIFLSRDPRKPRHWDVMILGDSLLLVACHHPEKFWDHIIGILIVKRKNASSKCEFYVLPLKNWVDWITSRQEKNGTTSKIYT